MAPGRSCANARFPPRILSKRYRKALKPGSLWLRPWPLLLLAAGGALLLFFGVTGFRLLHAAAEAPAEKTEVIAIFGAAEYAGRPSPVYRARLDHAYELFQKGMAPVVITTGGAGQDPDFSEGGGGRGYLLWRGGHGAGSERGDAGLRYGAVGGAGRQHHALQRHAQLHCSERCVSCIPHSRLAGTRRRASRVGA